MKKTESECVQCGKPCMGNACPNFAVTRFYCDKCGNEDMLFEWDGQELCRECVLEEIPSVEGSY